MHGDQTVHDWETKKITKMKAIRVFILFFPFCSSYLLISMEVVDAESFTYLIRIGAITQIYIQPVIPCILV